MKNVLLALASGRRVKRYGTSSLEPALGFWKQGSVDFGITGKQQPLGSRSDFKWILKTERVIFYFSSFPRIAGIQRRGRNC